MIKKQPSWLLQFRIFGGFAMVAVLQTDWLHAAPEGPAAPVYQVKLLTDSTPDLTDVGSYLRSITSQFDQPQDQAIAIWRWSQRLRKQTSNPQEGGQDVLDPIVLFNNYGHCNCGIVSGLNNTFWLNMGWKARYVQLGDHTVCETSWNDGKTWHMFDTSTSFYCFNDEGQVASVAEIEKNPRFYLENFAPECGTNPVAGPEDHQGWRQASDFPVHYQRTLANGVDSFKAPNSISEADLHAQWGQRFVLNLRPGEHLTRYFGHLPGEAGAAEFRPLKTGKNPEGQHGHAGIRANGVWEYAPDLRGAGAASLVYEESGVKWGEERAGFAVRAAEAGVPGTVVFRVAAANVVTSARLNLTVSRETGADGVSVDISRTAGITWEPAWSASGTGTALTAEVDLRELTAGVSEYLVRVRLTGAGAGLESVRLRTITQINRASLPRLTRGANRVQLTLGPQVETVQFQPSLMEGRHRATVFEDQGVDVEKEMGYYKPLLRPSANRTSASATWKLAVPTPITAVNYGGSICVKSAKDRVTLLHSWDGREFTRDYQKTDDSQPWDLMINREAVPALAGPREVFLRYEFETEANGASYRGPGIQSARMMVAHEPRVKGFTPVEITYCWTEHHAGGDVERRHTALAETPAHEYVIHAGGYRDPTMRWVRLNLQGSAPAGESAAPGDADGRDPGPGQAPERARYHWGKNLAKGRSYTLTGAVDDKNPDAGGDLTDGIIAPPDEYVSVKYMPTNVIFKKETTSVLTLDLGSLQEVAALRLHAGQEPGFRLAFPATIRVETSADGSVFEAAGQAGHHQVFDPPADFVPWENDDSPKYAGLPAGGRLAYAYRVILPAPVSARFVRVTCAPQPGWGLLLSEAEVFDSVKVDREVPPAVVLPKLVSSRE